MIRLAIPISVAAALLALLAIAGPALSLRPYRPDPVDFEVAPGGDDVKAAGSGQTVALRAPKRFNLVGARWRGRAEPELRLRVRKADGRWSAWSEVPAHADHAPDPGREGGGEGASDPVWVGEADEVQLRSSRRLPGLRLHFVNATGTATAADRARTALRRSVNGALLAAARTVDPVVRAAAAQPAIVPREQWGAQDCPPRDAPSYGEVKAAFVHHTVSMNDYTREEAPAMVLAICRYHRNSNGWADIGYSFLVDKYGTIYEGRAGGVDRAVIGAHTQGYNAQSMAVSNLGTFSDVPQTDAGLDAMARLIQWKLPLHGQPTAGPVTLTSAGGASNRFPAGSEVTFERISGHRDGNSTACPGDALYAQLPELRRRVGGAPSGSAPGPTSAPTRLDAAASRLVRFPGQARVAGRLRLSTGASVKNAAVDVEQLSGGVWRAVGRTRTGGSGKFEVMVPLSGKRTIRARFPGDEARAPTTSRGAFVTVVPELSLGRAPKRAAARQPVSLTGEIGPYRTRIAAVVERLVKGRYRRVASLRLAPQRVIRPSPEGDEISYGTFQRTWQPAKGGRYRVYVVFPGDRRFGATRSRMLSVRVAGGAPAASERR